MRTARRTNDVALLLTILLVLGACSDTGPSALSTPAFDESVATNPEKLAEVPPAEEAGDCPSGYEFLGVKQPNVFDVNGNGFVCYDAKTGITIDDGLGQDGADTEFAAGHGNLLATGFKGPQDISFSFHGKQNKLMVVKGEFEMHDQTNGLNVHGDVTCLMVRANEAQLGGIVTQSTDSSLPVGASIAWAAMDNGEGIIKPVDFVSRPFVAGKSPRTDCHRLFKPSSQLIASGNIQVQQ